MCRPSLRLSLFILIEFSFARNKENSYTTLMNLTNNLIVSAKTSYQKLCNGHIYCTYTLLRRYYFFLLQSQSGFRVESIITQYY